MADDAKPTAASSASDETRRIGRGALYLTITKLYFIVGSYVIYFGIPRLGGDRGDGLLGDYKAAGAWLSVIGTVLVMGTTQAIARFVGREPEKARGISGRGLRLQVGLGVLVAGTYFLAAPFLAEDSPELITPMRISAAIPLIYAMYSVFMGTLNGERRFGEQALMDGSFTTLKIFCVLGFVLAMQSAAGGYVGFATAAAAVLVLGVFMTRRGHGSLSSNIGATPTSGEIFRFQLQTVGFMFLVQWIVQMDLWYVIWFSDLSEASLTLESGEVLTTSQAARAVYAGTQLFSQISYSVVVSLTFVLFPLISRLGDDRAAARNYIREALRYAIIMVVGVASLLTAVPGPTLDMLMRDLPSQLSLMPGAEESLRWLGAGYVCFSLLFVLCSVLNAAGRPRQSIALMATVLGVQLGAGFVLTSAHGPVGQGIAGLIAMAVGLALGLFTMGRWVGNVVPLPTVGRVLTAGLAVYGLALAWHPEGKLMTLVRLIACGVVYLVVVIALREFTKDDMAKFKKILPGKTA